MCGHTENRRRRYAGAVLGASAPLQEAGDALGRTDLKDLFDRREKSTPRSSEEVLTTRRRLPSFRPCSTRARSSRSRGAVVQGHVRGPFRAGRADSVEPHLGLRAGIGEEERGGLRIDLPAGPPEAGGCPDCPPRGVHGYRLAKWCEPPGGDRFARARAPAPCPRPRLSAPQRGDRPASRSRPTCAHPGSTRADGQGPARSACPVWRRGDRATRRR